MVIDLLHERGVVLPASLAADITATLREVGDAGDARTVYQFVGNVHHVCIMYLCELPGEKLVAWHGSLRQVRQSGLAQLSALTEAAQEHLYDHPGEGPA